MVMLTKSILVTDQDGDWMTAQIAAGHDADESEIIRELIRERRLYEPETSEIAVLREKLIAAEQHGASVASPETLLSEIKAGMRHGRQFQDKRRSH